MKYLFIIIVILLQGCATPVGKFTDDDFAWERKTVDRNYQEVYRTILAASRKCEYVTEGQLFTDIQEGNFDIYLPGTLGGKSAWVFGVIKVKGVSERKTDVAVGVTKKYDAPVFGAAGERRKFVMAWSDGVSGCP